MSKLQVTPTFVNTKNVRNFQVMMDALALGAGEGRLGLVYGRAGRGKTRTAQWYHAHNDCVFLRMATVWRTSELYFLQALCKECGIAAPAGRKGPAFAQVVDELLTRPRPIFLDEIEKLPKFFLDLVRDISDLSTAPVILIGEDELHSYMQQNRRVWSRTYQQLHFQPIEVADAMVYFKEIAGVQLPVDAAKLLHQNSGGDFRIIRRDTLSIIHYANAKGTDQITVDLVQLATKSGLTGR